MVEWFQGHGGAQPRAAQLSLAAFALAVATVALMGVGPHGQLLAAFALLLVGLGLLIPFHHGALTWPNIVAATVVVVLVIPIRREAVAGALPFQLEPYRVFIALVLVVWLGALLVDRRVRLRGTFIDGPLLAVLGATFASVILNQERIRKLAVEASVAKATFFLLAFFLFAWFVVSVLRTFEEVDLVVRVLVATGAIVGLFALIEARTGFSIFDRISRAIPGAQRTLPADSNLNNPIRGGRLRIFGSAQHPIEFSAIMAILVPLGLYLAYTTRQRRWYVALCLLVLGVVAPVSRTGILMLIVVIAVFLWLRPTETRRLWPLLVPGLVVVRIAAPGAIRELFAGFFPAGGLFAEQQSETVGSSRLASLGPGLHEVALHPFFGGGYGSRIVTGPTANAFIVDDMWLSLAIQVGVVGVLAWTWLFIRYIRRTSHVAKQLQTREGWLLVALIASVFAYAIGMFTFDSLSFIQVTFLMVLLLALGAALMRLAQDDRGPGLPPPA